MEQIPEFLIDAELSDDGGGVVVELTKHWTKSKSGTARSAALSPAETRAIAVFLVLLADFVEDQLVKNASTGA